MEWVPHPIVTMEMKKMVIMATDGGVYTCTVMVMENKKIDFICRCRHSVNEPLPER